MKRIWTRILTITALTGTLAISAMAAGPAERQVNQNTRIKQGIQSGELTRAEVARLRQQQAQLHRQVVRNRADGGGLNRAERARIQANANQNSRQIRRLKNNDRTR